MYVLLQPDFSRLASHMFTVNFMCVLYELSSKITSDKVSNVYPFIPKTRVDITETTRIHMDANQSEEYAKSFGKNFLNIL